MKESENLKDKLKKLPKYELSHKQKAEIIHALKEGKQEKKRFVSLKPLIAFTFILLIVGVLIFSMESNPILNDVMHSTKPKIQLTAPKATVFNNEPYEVVGVEDKVGILMHERLVANDDRRSAKLMLYFWGDPSKLIDKNYRVEAVNENNDKMILSKGKLDSPVANEDAHTLTSFPAIPTSGTWQFSFYVDNHLFEEFTIDVLPPFPKTENYQLLTSPPEISHGKKKEVYIESLLGKKQEIEVIVVNSNGEYVYEELFTQSSEAIDSKTGQSVYLYSGFLVIPDLGTWTLKIDGEQTESFEN